MAATFLHAMQDQLNDQQAQYQEARLRQFQDKWTKIPTGQSLEPVKAKAKVPEVEPVRGRMIKLGR
jgi:hypothetical protein